MNSFERKELKQAKESRENWKQKVMDRNAELRKVRRKIRDLTQSRAMWRERYFSDQKELEQTILPVSPSPTPVVDNQQLYFIMVSLCINLTINCSVSFRSIPKILSVFANLFQRLGIHFQLIIPHFTTVIGWTLRVGKYLLERTLICLVYPENSFKIPPNPPLQKWGIKSPFLKGGFSCLGVSRRGMNVYPVNPV